MAKWSNLLEAMKKNKYRVGPFDRHCDHFHLKSIEMIIAKRGKKIYQFIYFLKSIQTFNKHFEMFSWKLNAHSKKKTERRDDFFIVTIIFTWCEISFDRTSVAA